MLAEITLTTELIVAIVGVVSVVISVILYLGALDRRITILESKTINKDEFYKQMAKLKDDIIDKIDELKNER